MSTIGRLNETDLHEQLKHLYAGTDGRVEVDIEGFVVDVARDHELIEIQTGSVRRLRKKMIELTRERSLRIVIPIASKTRIIKRSPDGAVLSSRLSPKRGRVEMVFRELAAIADLLPHPKITVEVVLVETVEHRVADGTGSWRRGGVRIASRAMGRIDTTVTLKSGPDYLHLLPDGLPTSFTNRDLAGALSGPYRIVQPMTSSFRKMGLLTIDGKRGRELLYSVTKHQPDGDGGP